MAGFNWNDFTNLGIEYLNSSNQAKQRTGISRFYYGAFCSSRDLINKNGTYLGKKSKKIMNNKSADVHGETSRIFKHHNAYQKTKEEKSFLKT